MSRYISQPRIEEPIWLNQDDLCFLHTRISETEIQLESLENQISELSRQRDAKLVEIASYRNICSPVRRVPQEILSIFLEICCLPADGFWNSSYDIIRQTSILSRVCVAWRRAVLSTPQLWSKLCLTTSSHSHTKLFKGDAWLKEWIERCRGCPLDLYLHFDKSQRLQGLSRLFESILHFGHKIRSMDVQATPSLYLPLFHLPASSLPLLEQFSFEVKDADQWPYDTVAALIPLFPHKTNILLDAPKLRCVKIKEYNNVPILELLALPTEQLTSLEINWSGNPEDLDTKRHVYVDILCQCKALRNLKLTYRSLVRVPVEHTGISSDLIISLPVLKSLEISCDKVTGPGVALLRCLRTPHLEELSLHHGSQDIRDLSMDLAYFRQHCAPALSSLSLHNFWLAVVIFPPDPRPESFLGILPLFPDIQSLWISNSHFNARPLFQALAYVDEPHQVLLPKLTEFGLENCYNSDCSSELTNMVLSRDSASDTGHGLARLQKLTVYVPRRHLKKEKFARISGLPGLDFDLRVH